MKMSSNRRRAVSIILLLFLFISAFQRTFAQEEADGLPLDIQLLLDRSALTQNETAQADLILRNTSPFTLTNVEAQLQGATFQITNLPTLPDTLLPYSSAEVEYTLQNQRVGSHNVVFVVQYSWDDSSGISRQWIESVSIERIEVIPWIDFKWPDYLIPLIFGFLVGQFGSWFTERRKERREAQLREEQAKGVVLAVLQTVREGVKQKEKISYALWEEAVLKANLYPALHQWAQRVGAMEILQGLAELPIILADYNDRQITKNLTDDYVTQLIDKLTKFIRILENR